MKKIFLSIAFVVSTISISAQQQVFCYVTCVNQGVGGEKPIFCLVDIGQMKYANITHSALRDEAGEIKLFNSPMQVFNHLASLGWHILGDIKKGSSVDSNSGAIWGRNTQSTSGTVTYECVMYKDLKEGETQEQAFSDFSQWQQQYEPKSKR
jgi:hypothetical protein